MNRKVLVIGGVGVLISLGLCLIFFLSHKYDFQTEPDIVYEKAPGFELPTATGESINLANLKGELTILTFWASWSPYSKEELVSLSNLKMEYGDRITIAALNRDANPADGRVFLNSLGLGDAVVFVYDTQDEYFKKVHGFAMPETLFLDSDENILVHQHGPMTFDEMHSTIEQLLN